MSSWMSLALEWGRKAVGISRPNPAVGAVVVKNGIVYGKGHTQKPGCAHAEVMALEMANENAKDADLYVTLEPCTHFGRTPPCTEAIISKGIRRVFFAHGDPNPLVRGNSKKILEEHGIEVFEGLEACGGNKNLFKEIEEFFEAYDYFVFYKKPFVVLKLAMTLDGFIAHKDYSACKITHEQGNVYNHQRRADSDCLLVSTRTALLDNPQLNIRHVNGNQPIKILFGNSTEIPVSLKLFKESKPMIFSGCSQKHLENAADVIHLPYNSFEENWDFMLSYLGNLGMHRIMVEPGQKLFQMILNSKLWNKCLIWKSDFNLKEGIKVEELPKNLVEIKEFGEDTLYVYYNS